MKKLNRSLSLFLAFIIFTAGTVFHTCAFSADESVNANAFLFGDVNLDGSVSSADALLALQKSVSKISLTSSQRIFANVDGKSAVTASDALLILQYTVNKISSFPCSLNSAISGSPYTPSSVYYSQQTGDKNIVGPVTTMQEEATYSGAINLATDSVMVYIRNIAGLSGRISSWATANTGKTLDVMLAINRDNSNEYYTLHPERQGMDSQTKADGSHIIHAADGDYMVPTESYISYKCDVIDEILKYNNIGFIALEEPEMFMASGYSQGFKDEWVKYYGTAWEDQTSSAEALYKTSKLKVYLFERAVETISAHIKSISPDVKLVIASHCSSNYINHSIVSSISSLAKLDCIDGVIGQTWSDCARFSMPYDGGTTVDGFLESFLEYSSYPNAVSDDDWFFALADPCADNTSFSWDEHRYWYEKTIVSQLMFASINRFETIWPSRSFATAPKEYKTMQMNILAAQKELAGKGTIMYSGTTGIYLAQSDTETWQYGSSYMAAQNSLKAITGLSIPLIEKGIPLQTLNLEAVESADDLKEVKILILSYDCMKPLSEENNIAISDWVKNGGTLIYMGGHDEFENIGGEWWSDLGKTPLENLLTNLGLSGITVGEGLKASDGLSYTGTSGFFGNTSSLSLTETIANYSASFTGSGFSTFLKSGNNNIGIEASAGNGKVLCIGLPSSYYASAEGGAQFMRDAVEYALSSSELQYLESNTMLIKRGNVIAAQILENPETLTGNFIDLFEPTLPVISSKSADAKTSLLLYDISELLNAETPVLAFTGGTIKGNITQTESATSFSLTSAASATISVRLLGNGKNFESATVTRGDTNVNNTCTWDEATNSLLIQFVGGSSKADITVNWSNAS